MNFSGRKNAKCGGRLIKPIENDDERHFKLKGSHIHKPDARKLSTKKVLTKLKTLAKTTNNSPRDIVVEATTNVKSATLAVLPSVKLMKRTAKRVRRSENIPKQPQTLSALFLEGEFRITSNGENFILYDNGPIEELDERIIIFGTEKNLEFLATCTEFYMDGTFKVTPPLFKQLYTIHGLYSFSLFV